MNQYKHFEIDEAAIIRDRTAIDPSLWRLLRRLCLPEKFNDPHGGIIKRAVVVDVETPGLSTENDDVIQLAIVRPEYSPEGGGWVFGTDRRNFRI